MLNLGKRPKPTIWKPIESLEDWESAKENSHQSPVVIFKHSTRCSVSSVAKDRFERSIDQSAVPFQLFLLDLITYRSVSRQIAADTGIAHESPQIILLKNGKPVFHASHLAINIEPLLASL